jgi:2-keto-3-deoxygluconate transporter
MYLFTVGTKMTLNAAPRMLKRGFGIMAAKLAVAMGIALMVAKIFDGSLLGFSTLALMVAMSDTNGGMFLALTSVMGDPDDAGTYVPQSIETGPFITMMFLVGAGLANIPWLTMVSVIAPIAAGAVLGNLDRDLRDFFGKHEPVIVPFMAFMLGQNINLKSVVTAGLSGVGLGVFVVAVTGCVCILADRLLGDRDGNPHAGTDLLDVSTCTTKPPAHRRRSRVPATVSADCVGDGTSLKAAEIRLGRAQRLGRFAMAERAFSKDSVKVSILPISVRQALTLKRPL